MLSLGFAKGTLIKLQYSLPFNDVKIKINEQNIALILHSHFPNPFSKCHHTVDLFLIPYTQPHHHTYIHRPLLQVYASLRRTQWLTAFVYLTKTLLFRMSPQVLLQISSTQSFNRSASLSSEIQIISLIISVTAQESCRCSYYFQKLWQVRKDQGGNRLSFLCIHDFSILYTISKQKKKIAQ